MLLKRIWSIKKLLYYNGKSTKSFLTEEAAYYNDYALKEFGVAACLNNITTNNTTIDFYFSDNTITLEFIENITKITELKEVYRAKSHWIVSNSIN